MRFSIKVALRFLLSSKLQTLIIILGIGIGISVQIFIGSLIQGLQKSLVEKTIGNSSQITVSLKDDKAISDYSSLIKKIKSADEKINAVSPVSDHAAFLSVDEKSQSLLVRGFDFSLAEDIYHFSEYLTEGSLPKNKNDILLGKSVAKEYGIKAGDTVTLITPSQKKVSCNVTGFFDLKVAQVNNSWCVTTLLTAGELFDSSGTVTSIELQLKDSDVFLADTTAKTIKSKLNDNNYIVDNWKSENEQLLSGLQGQSISSIMIQVFVMISVILGIASVLAITVMQKSKQIGILKAMGVKNRTASLIFITEGFVLGILGAITGILLGLGLGASFTTFALNPDGTPVVELYFSNSFILLSGVVAVFSCVAAALIPARRSSKLNPIDIIRNN